MRAKNESTLAVGAWARMARMNKPREESTRMAVAMLQSLKVFMGVNVCCGDRIRGAVCVRPRAIPDLGRGGRGAPGHTGGGALVSQSRTVWALDYGCGDTRRPSVQPPVFSIARRFVTFDGAGGSIRGGPALP